MLSFFPLDVLNEIWDVIESVSEGFLTYSYKHQEYLCQEPFLMNVSLIFFVANQYDNM